MQDFRICRIGGINCGETRKLTEQEIENLTIEIREFLLEYEMWVDVDIYFNGKCFTTHDKTAGKFYYNDREHLVVRENENPRTYLNMSIRNISAA